MDTVYIGGGGGPPLLPPFSHNPNLHCPIILLYKHMLNMFPAESVVKD